MDDSESGVGPSSEGRAAKTLDGAPGQGLSDHTQKRIGLHLRAMYDTIVQQPVPDRFRDLIAKLDASAPSTDS
ncbi:NepR family anti-sigma factor [Methylobacterium sp. J-068]|uniref:NepR family anti-sigma factor n=1 Tax=Methylobacterium sp. J-068 TaxID=2836649 RepID=UPI001FBB8985|nr:NepR family anti-sigma factor [Methylobacterium sp. J-068]MCJ2037130.1 anti-sigma factor [Methylobacterium sp. J-068]